jgi:hypothetical protein
VADLFEPRAEAVEEEEQLERALVLGGCWHVEAPRGLRDPLDIVEA